MRVTGYQLREAIRRWQLRRATAASQFKATLHAFPGDDKPTPQSVAEAALRAEMMLGALGAAQARYNGAVRIEAHGFGKMFLIDAVKQLGGLVRIEKMWRDAAQLKKHRYEHLTDKEKFTRDKDAVTAKRTVSLEQAAGEASRIGAKLGALREAIARGNSAEIELDLDAALFE